METLVRGRRDLAIPVEALSGLREALRREGGPLVAVHALQDAGYTAGTALFRKLSEDVHGDVTEIDEELFWHRISEFLSRRGWGSLAAETDGYPVGILASPDWAESDGVEEEEPCCYFTSGLLSGILSELAGEPVAVLEVECRGSGSDRCRFAFGAEAALHDLYGALLEGVPLDEALAAV